MAEERPDDRVSRERHDAVSAERDQLKSQVSDLTAATRDAATWQRAFDTIAEKSPNASAQEVAWATKTVLPHVKDLDNKEAIDAKLDSDFAPLFSSIGQTENASAPPQDSDAVTEVAAIAATDTGANTPGFAAPSPGGDGETVADKKFARNSPEWNAASQLPDHEYKEWIATNDKAGRLVWRTAAS